MSSENYEKLRLQIRGVEGRVARIEEHLGLVAPPPPTTLIAGAEVRTPREVESSRNPNKPTVTKQTTGVAHTMTVRRVGAPVVTRAAAPPAAPAAVVPSSAGPQAGAGVGEQLLGVLEGLSGLLQVLRVPQPGEQASPAPPAAPVAPVQQPSSSGAGELDWLEQEQPDTAAAVPDPSPASVQG